MGLNVIKLRVPGENNTELEGMASLFQYSLWKNGICIWVDVMYVSVLDFGLGLDSGLVLGLGLRMYLV